MFGVISLPDAKRSRRSRYICDDCRVGKLRCLNAARREPQDSGVPPQPCARCVGAGKVCRYNGQPSHSSVTEAREQTVVLKPKTPITTQNEVSGWDSLASSLVNEIGGTVPVPTATRASPAIDQLLSACDYRNSSAWSHEYQDVQANSQPLAQGFSTCSGLSNGDAVTPRLQSFSEIQVNDEEHLGDMPDPLVFAGRNFAASMGFPYQPVEQDDQLGSRSPFERLQKEYGEDIDQYFEHLHIAIPLLDREMLHKRLATSDPTEIGPLGTLLAGLRLAARAARCRFEPTASNQRSLVSQLVVVERNRGTYDFAESPDLDTVAVSLFMFCAYHTIDKPNRAFLYLYEACDFFNIVSAPLKMQISGATDVMRRVARTELVLANTQTASCSLYAANVPNMRRQISLEQSILLLENNPPQHPSEKRIDELLVRMTQIHLVAPEKYTGLDSALRSLEFCPDSDAPFIPQDIDSFTRPPVSPQSEQSLTADVIISGQWRAIEILAHQLSTTAEITSAEIRQRLAQTVVARCSTAVACSAALGEGQLRILGLGKLVKISIDSMGILMRASALLSGLWAYHYKTILSGLVFTIMRADHERVFAPGLRSCIELIGGESVARSLPYPMPAPVPSRCGEEHEGEGH